LKRAFPKGDLDGLPLIKQEQAYTAVMGGCLFNLIFL